MNHYSAFDELTPEAKYWCGFIAGDGCVTTNCVKFNLSWIDHEHLDAFAKFLGSSKKAKEVFVDHPLIFGSGHMAQLSVGSVSLARRLSSLGMIQRKCKLDFQVCKELSLSRDFWRGMIDADGSVNLSKNHGKLFPVISLSQNGREIINQYSHYIFTVSGYKFEPDDVGAWRIAFNGNKARDIINHLWYDDCICLERKRDTAEACRRWKGIRELNRDTGYLSIRSNIKKGDYYKYSLKTFVDPVT